MSLFKQISIMVSLLLFIIIISVMTLNFKSAAAYAQDELYANAQNTVSSLSLSLANAKGDIPTISTMINAVFDSGYYKEIRLYDMQGDNLYSRLKENEKEVVPSWFLELFKLEVDSASAHVSSGWSPIGVLEVIPLKQGAHIKLYNNFLDLLKTFALIFVVSLVLLYLLLRFILASLYEVKRQAEAVSKSDFILTKNIPYTTEFKEVTLAMNKMVLKVKDIFDKEAQAVSNYHKLLYTDPLSGFGNRKYFDMELKSLIHAEDLKANGLILNFFFDGIEFANKQLGHEKVDCLIEELALEIQNAIKDEPYAMKVRLDGTKFCIIFPIISGERVHEVATFILEASLAILKNYQLKDCGIKISVINYLSNNTVLDVVKEIEQSILQTQKNSIFIPSLSTEFNINEKQEQEELLKDALDNKNFSLALQAVFDTNMNIYHHEAYIRLMNAQGDILPAGTFMPLVHKMKLNTKLDIEVIQYAIKNCSFLKEAIAINISLDFIKDEASLVLLKELLKQSTISLSFELSNHDILSSLESTLAFAKIIQASKHSFGIDKFSAVKSNLDYLQALKPSYIKIDSHYLRDMLCQQAGVQNNALDILIDSLDAKIIATAIEEESIKEALVKVGIKYFQGSLLAKAKML